MNTQLRSAFYYSVFAETIDISVMRSRRCASGFEAVTKYFLRVSLSPLTEVRGH